MKHQNKNVTPSLQILPPTKTKNKGGSLDRYRLTEKRHYNILSNKYRYKQTKIKQRQCTRQRERLSQYNKINKTNSKTKQPKERDSRGNRSKKKSSTIARQGESESNSKHNQRPEESD